MTYQVEFVRSAERELWRLPEPLRSSIYRAIEKLGVEPRPRGCLKLVGSKNAWRIRIGAYRVVYSLEDVLRIVRIEDRSPQQHLSLTHFVEPSTPSTTA